MIEVKTPGINGLRVNLTFSTIATTVLVCFTIMAVTIVVWVTIPSTARIAASAERAANRADDAAQRNEEQLQLMHQQVDELRHLIQENQKQIDTATGLLRSARKEDKP